jgi:hypothetical protein
MKIKLTPQRLRAKGDWYEKGEHRAFILSSVVFTFLDASIVIDLIFILAMSHHSLKFEKDFFSNFQYTHQFVNSCRK